MPLAFNQLKVVCRNKECKYHGKERLASVPIVGSGLSFAAMIMCECGYAPHLVEIPDPPKKEKINGANC